MRHISFAKYAWGVLVYNLAVILWGAFVRASGSGAGCGSHWPLCDGAVIPRAAQVETLIEFTHRFTSGVAFLLVVALAVWAFRAYPKSHHIRWGAGLAMAFMVSEAMVGAWLVLSNLVAENDSMARALVMAIHLLNTFLLLAFLTLTAWWASGGKPLLLRRADAFFWLLGLGLLGMLVLGASGAVAALGDTLFPSQSFSQALREDFSPTAHLLIRLRVLHPTLAALVSAYLILLSAVIRARKRDLPTRQASQVLTLFLVLQLGIGIMNVLLLAPIWLQLVHLLVADLIWISLVILAALTLAVQPASSPARAHLKDISFKRQPQTEEVA